MEDDPEFWLSLLDLVKSKTRILFEITRIIINLTRNLVNLIRILDRSFSITILVNIIYNPNIFLCMATESF